MNTQTVPTLTAGQRSLLAGILDSRKKALARQLNEHQQGMSRAEHAAAMLGQDADDPAQHAGEQEVDMALSNLDMRELDAVEDALRRVHAPDFGLCGDCGQAIPFDRLKAEPQARRCVPCQTTLEGNP